ncbi:MAG: hypothetical protein ACLUEK_08855 [Oscillospiraceae bacterium]
MAAASAWNTAVSNALVLVKGAPMLFDEVCHSCGVCVMRQPRGAVSETEREVGAVETGMSGEIKVATGELKLGRPRACR